jgi:hypothetical protein
LNSRTCSSFQAPFRPVAQAVLTQHPNISAGGGGTSGAAA